MEYEICCPVCNAVEEIDFDIYFQEDKTGNCKGCGNEFYIDFDCEYQGAVLIVYWKKKS